MTVTDKEPLLAHPNAPGRLIFEESRMMAAPLLDARKFAKYCQERDLQASVKRLSCLERLGVFRPLVRFRDDGELKEKLVIPGGDVPLWFDKGWLIDTYDKASSQHLSPHGGEQSQAYYSKFQIDDLSLALDFLTVRLELDSYLEADNEPIDWRASGERWMEHAQAICEQERSHTFRPAIALLCQYIADRYYPHTQTNKRMMNAPGPGGYAEDEWMIIDRGRWNWRAAARAFDPKEVETRFSLTPAKLEQAYRAIGGAASTCDPLDRWANLVEFIPPAQKRKLKGKALRAQSLREAAHMLRLLHRSLYEAELPPSHEIFGQVITHLPELDQRKDVRRHLEFVVNQYDLNPQPNLVLFVEGQSEVELIEVIFDELFGVHPGVVGVEIINLGGVNNATGDKKRDRFTAIFRLIDYLHHHQTMTFLILDNENQARALKAAASSKKSLHGQQRRAVPKAHIQLWKPSLEFDNFSNTEIARAMGAIAANGCAFSVAEVRTARAASAPGAALARLYKDRTGGGLDKLALAAVLGEIMLSQKTRKDPFKRPLVRMLQTVVQLAIRNPRPTRHSSWIRNQAARQLGGY